MFDVECSMFAFQLNIEHPTPNIEHRSAEAGVFDVPQRPRLVPDWHHPGISWRADDLAHGVGGGPNVGGGMGHYRALRRPDNLRVGILELEAPVEAAAPSRARFSRNTLPLVL